MVTSTELGSQFRTSNPKLCMSESLMRELVASTSNQYRVRALLSHRDLTSTVALFLL